MCGVAGVLNFKPSSEVSKHLQNMPALLKHRGPENVGTWHHNDIFLSQTRLKIIDLSEKANQPLFNEDKSLVLVFNGEVYNYQTLRKDLKHKGHTFSSQGDSEVILHLYEEKGLDFVKELDGMFAFALWDEKKKILILARDRTGKKPLFYTQTDSFFAFASEIKAFLPLFGGKLTKNETHFPYYFLYGHIPTPHTFYKNIFSLEPAHFLTFNFLNKELKKECYWDPKPFYLAKKKMVSEPEATTQIRILLKEAVSKRLVADVPIGIFLSGGIDSSIVAAVVTQELGHSLQTFSIGFDGDSQYDETAYAKEVASAYGTKHVEYHVKPQMVIDSIDKLLWHYDGPFGDSSAIPTSIVSQLAKEKVTVILNGDGGDEVFGGYHRFVASLWMDKIPFLSRVLLKKLFKVLPSHIPFQEKGLKLTEAATLTLTERLTRWTSYFYEDLYDLLNEDFCPRGAIQETFHYNAHLNGLQEMTPLSQILYLNLKTYLLDDLNVKMDRASMMHALETRSPFLDQALIEYCATLPDHFFIRGFQTKYILKKAYQNILPPKIYKRGKAGFGVPLGKWFRGPLKDFLIESLTDTRKSHPYLNRDATQNLLKQHFNGKDLSQKLWVLLLFTRWLERDNALDTPHSPSIGCA